MILNIFAFFCVYGEKIVYATIDAWLEINKFKPIYGVKINDIDPDGKKIKDLIRYIHTHTKTSSDKRQD